MKGLVPPAGLVVALLLAGAIQRIAEGPPHDDGVASLGDHLLDRQANLFLTGR